MDKKAKNGEIEVLRFLFCLTIMLGHFKSNFDFPLDLFKRGAFAVGFFFLTSGYFMARSASKVCSDNYSTLTYDFLKRKISSFFPYYLVSVIIYIIVYNVFLLHKSAWDLLIGVVKLVPEALFLQMGGFATESPLNIPAVWYLSAMLLAMLILYPLTLKFKQSYGIIFAVIGIFGLGFLNVAHGGYIVTFRTTWRGFMYDGMIWAIAEVALGAACFQFCSWLAEKKYSSLQKILLTIFKYAAWIGAVVFCLSDFNFKYEICALTITVLAFILTCSEITYNLPYNKITNFLGRFSLPLYLFHSIVQRCALTFIDKKISIQTLCILVVITIVCSVAFKYAVEFIMSKLSKMRRKSAADN